MLSGPCRHREHDEDRIRPESVWPIIDRPLAPCELPVREYPVPGRRSWQEITQKSGDLPVVRGPGYVRPEFVFISNIGATDLPARARVKESQMRFMQRWIKMPKDEVDEPTNMHWCHTRYAAIKRIEG